MILYTIPGILLSHHRSPRRPARLGPPHCHTPWSVYLLDRIPCHHRAGTCFLETRRVRRSMLALNHYWDERFESRNDLRQLRENITAQLNLPIAVAWSRVRAHCVQEVLGLNGAEAEARGERRSLSTLSSACPGGKANVDRREVVINALRVEPGRARAAILSTRYRYVHFYMHFQPHYGGGSHPAAVLFSPGCKQLFLCASGTVTLRITSLNSSGQFRYSTFGISFGAKPWQGMLVASSPVAF